MSAATDALLQRDSLLTVWELRAVWVAILTCFISSVCYMVWLFLPGRGIGRMASRVLSVGALMQTAAVVLRMAATGRAPSQTLYESLLWFAWSVVVIYLFMERRFKGLYAGGFPVAGVAFGASLYAVLGCSPEAAPLFADLRNGWFIWRVMIASLSYAIFVVAFAVEFGYVILARVLPPRMLSRYGMSVEKTARFHRVAHQLVLSGFPLLTCALISGAVWTEQAWGRYLLWDPTKAWPLITWTVYALYLHAMTMGKWRGGRASTLNMLGFVCTVITLLGANWIANLLGIPGLHAFSM